MEKCKPYQYSQNVATSGTSERVEYAIKLPGADSNGSPVWLPIDAKFPIEDYQRLIEASERADVANVERASRQLDSTLKTCAKSLNESPPTKTLAKGVAGHIQFRLNLPFLLPGGRSRGPFFNNANRFREFGYRSLRAQSLLAGSNSRGSTT